MLERVKRWCLQEKCVMRDIWNGREDIESDVWNGRREIHEKVRKMTKKVVRTCEDYDNDKKGIPE